MKACELNKLLLDNFVELKESFEEETNWQEGLDTGSTVVFEDVFMPYVRKMMEENNIDKINDIFSFIEKIVNLNDDYATMVITVSILENITTEEDYSPYLKYMGSNTLKCFNGLFD